MIPEIIKQWDENKDKLRSALAGMVVDEYIDFVKLIFTHVISGYNPAKITVIDNGDYQGTEIFFIPKDSYQPDAKDYLFTHNNYGSCSGCDTLQGINCNIYDYELGKQVPTEETLNDYMTLCLHLVQRLAFLKPNYAEEDYEFSKD